MSGKITPSDELYYQLSKVCGIDFCVDSPSVASLFWHGSWMTMEELALCFAKELAEERSRTEAKVKAEFSQKIATELTPYQRAAYDAYWAAENYHEEHRALQRMVALGLDTGCEPCPELECVELRHREAARQGIVMGGGPGGSTERDDILAATREIARGG